MLYKTLDKILIRFPNWLGDAIMALPLIDYLNEFVPHLSITLLAPKAMVELLSLKKGIIEVLPYTKNSSADNRALLKNYPAILLLPNSFSSAWEVFRAGCPHRLGYAMHLRKYLLTSSMVPDPTLHHTQRYFQLLALLGISTGNIIPLASLTAHLSQATAQKFELHRHHYLVLAPGAAYGSAKSWPLNNFHRLIELIKKTYKGKIVLVGDASLSKDCHLYYGDVQVLDLFGKTTLVELAQLLAGASAYVGNDSGPSHLAAALGIPTYVLFGPTDPNLSLPKGKQVISFYRPVACSPCHLRQCPIDHRCMRLITPGEVYGKMGNYLK